MRTVKVIMGLVIKEKPLMSLYGCTEVLIRQKEYMSSPTSWMEIQTTSAPIIQICKSIQNGKGKSELFVAYNPEIETLLNEPIALLHKENEAKSRYIETLSNLNDQLQSECEGYQCNLEEVENMGFWRRLKFLFYRKAGIPNIYEDTKRQSKG